MKNTIRNLLFLSVLFFSVSYDSCTLGVDYDRKYKLYPEPDFSGCMFGISYGRRWGRLGLVTFSSGAILIFAAGIAWRRKKESKDLRRSILIKEE
jgi:hypothetical protein